MINDLNSKPKILCVDDEPGVLEALLRLFKDQFEVLTALDAEGALKIILENRDIAIILSDYRMPGRSGIDLLRTAKNFVPQAARAVLSGQMDIQAVSEAINKAEIHRFLLKPWENDFLKLQMLELLQLHSSLVEKGHLRLLSITDPVTRLTNHRYFQDRLKTEFEKSVGSGQPLSLIMLDVDHFKSFNDRYGHPEGDRLLAEIAQQIEKKLDAQGVASRYGGEEFAVILPGADLNKATLVANEIRQAVEQTAFSGPLGYRAYVTISLGVASFPLQGQSASELVKLADTALYQAKKQGRNQTVAANQ